MHYSNVRVTVARTNTDGWVRSSSSACRVTGPRSLASARTTAMVAGTFLPGSRRQCWRALATMESSGSIETSDASPAAAPARTSGSGSCVRLTSTPVSRSLCSWAHPARRSGHDAASVGIAAELDVEWPCLPWLQVPRPIGKRQKVAATAYRCPLDRGTSGHTFTMAYTLPRRRDAPVRGRCGGSKSVAEAPNLLYSSQL